MLVVQIDGVDAQAPETAFAGGAHVLRATVDPALGRVVRIAHDAELGGEHHPVALAPDRPADQGFVGVRAVHVRRVQQGDAEVEGAVDRGDGLRVVAAAVEIAHAHAAEAEGGNGKPLRAESPGFHAKLLCQ